MTEHDDLIGGGVRTERVLAAEKRLQEAARQAEIKRAGAGHIKIKADELRFLHVSQNWLSDFFDMDPSTVRKRLTKCPPAGMAGGNRPVYVFQEAVPYLIKPKWDIGAYIKTLNPAELPNSINKVFWEAERIKNKTLIETGEAWSTAKVLEVLGQFFMSVKDRIPLIKEGMRDAGLTDEQNLMLEGFCDQFQADIHLMVQELPTKQRTFSRIVEVDHGDRTPDADDE